MIQDVACPFCGTQDFQIASEEVDDIVKEAWFGICEGCGCRGPVALKALTETQEEAAIRAGRLWGRRVGAPVEETGI